MLHLEGENWPDQAWKRPSGELGAESAEMCSMKRYLADYNPSDLGEPAACSAWEQFELINPRY